MGQGSVVASILLPLLLPAAVASATVDAADVYKTFAEKRSDGERVGYLRTVAHKTTVDGNGTLETLSPRRFYDTSVPDSDPVVAVILVEPFRKIVCGLPKDVLDALGWLKEGSPVSFSGRLVDAQTWEGTGITLYLGQCSLKRR